MWSEGAGWVLCSALSAHLFLHETAHSPEVTWTVFLAKRRASVDLTEFLELGTQWQEGMHGKAPQFR